MEKRNDQPTESTPKTNYDKRHATVLPSAPDPINERPAGMSMKDYREARISVNKALRSRLKEGFLVYCAAEIIDLSKIAPSDDGGPSGSKGYHRHGQIRKTYAPFSGLTKFLQIV